MHTTTETVSAALNEGFYLGVAYAHVVEAVALLSEYRKALPLGHRQADHLRQLSVELTRIVAFRTANSPADARTVKEQVEGALKVAHIHAIEAGSVVSRTTKAFRAIDSRVVRARRALEYGEVA